MRRARDGAARPRIAPTAAEAASGSSSPALGPESPIAEHVRAPRRRCERTSASWSTMPRPRSRRRSQGALAGAGAQRRHRRAGRHPSGRHPHVRRTVHTFLDRSAYAGSFAPQFGPPVLPTPAGEPVGLTCFDHIVGNVEIGRLERVGRLLPGRPGLRPAGPLRRRPDLDRVLRAHVDGRVERDRSCCPSTSRRGPPKSQIEEYLDFYRSPGVRHLALTHGDIVETVGAMRDNEVPFLDVPPYYDSARAHGRRRPAGDMATSPSWGSWWTTTTRATCCRSSPSRCDGPTLFFEIIQRDGRRLRRNGNFKALFEAIEQAQAARGGLLTAAAVQPRPESVGLVQPGQPLDDLIEPSPSPSVGGSTVESASGS